MPMKDSHTLTAPEHLKTLYEITRSLNSSLDLSETLEYIMDRVVEVTRAERGFLMLQDDDTGLLRFEVARGMEQDDLESPEFEVSNTIIKQVLESGEPLLTSNAQMDQRLQTQKSILVKGLRSILCVPITVRERTTGLVYVDNRLHAGIFNETHRDLLAAFAGHAGTAIENARLYKVAVDRGRMQKELEMAHDIQKGLLSRYFEPLAGYEVACDWRPALEMGGDFYDCSLLGDSRMGVAVADVSGKGVPAAIFMAVARSLLRGNADPDQSPDQTMHRTNRMLIKDVSRGMFVTAYYAVFDREGNFQGVNAGHNCPLLFRAADNRVEAMPHGGCPMGWFEEIPAKIHQCRLAPGDVMVFYTDGLTEAENRSQESFEEERLVEVLLRAGRQPADQVMAAILEAVTDFGEGVPPHDDLTLVVVRYLGA